jgi:altronate dehydratase small subunit
MTARCFQVHVADNVATLLDDVSAAQTPVQVLGPAATAELVAREPIVAAHKIALRDITAGEPVIKFGVPIGRATKPILSGEWVHLHNLASNFDQRSQTLDVHSGATTDTRYE